MSPKSVRALCRSHLSLCAAILFAPIFSNASIDVAFVEIRRPNGQIVQLEPNGQFAHVAISYMGNWIHSYPRRGVEIISQENLEKIGAIKAIVTVSKENSLNLEQVEKYLDKSYDSRFSWSDDAVYCSELVGKILNILPRPMNFDPRYWPPQFQTLNGQPGLSPDGLFQILKENSISISD